MALISLCLGGLSGLFGLEVLHHVEQKVLHRIEQKVVQKLKQKLGSRIDQFKSRLHQRWNQIRSSWHSRLAGLGSRLASTWRSQAQAVETEAAAGDLARFPKGIPPEELRVARSSLVDASDTVSGVPIPDPAHEDPSQIRFDVRDADRSDAGAGQGNLQDRRPEPDTDAGNHSSELPSFPAEVEAVRSMCARHPACTANPHSDPGLDIAEEQLRMGRCCRVVEVSGAVVFPDAIVGAEGGIPGDAIPLEPGGVPVEPPVGGAGDPSPVTTVLPVDAAGTACDDQCQLFTALVEAAVHVLSDFDQTRHGADNQEGLGQLLPHRANTVDACSTPPPSPLTSFDNDLLQVGCEMEVDLADAHGDVRAAYALYVGRNHLPPLDAAWPGAAMPAPGQPIGDEPACAATSTTAPGNWMSPIATGSDSDFAPLVVTADCGRARVATASLLTAVSRIYFDWNTDPTSTMELNPLDSPATVSKAVPDGEGAPNQAAQRAAAAAYNAGFRGHDLLVATALAGAESRWDPGSTERLADGRVGVGLWRIPARPTTAWSTAELLDPAINAAAAFAISEPQGDFSGFCGFWSSGSCGRGVPGSEPAPFLAHVDEAREALADLVIIDTNQDTSEGPINLGGFSWPLRGQISQGFGCTALVIEPRAPACPGGHFHSGLDIAAACGSPIAAAGSGTLALHSSWGGYGNYVTIDHGDGTTSLYAHLGGFAQLEGAVGRGDVIGSEGSTGNSTGCHLHFEIRRHGVATDPRPLLP